MPHRPIYIPCTTISTYNRQHETQRYVQGRGTLPHISPLVVSKATSPLKAEKFRSKSWTNNRGFKRLTGGNPGTGKLATPGDGKQSTLGGSKLAILGHGKQATPGDSEQVTPGGAGLLALDGAGQGRSISSGGNVWSQPSGGNGSRPLSNGGFGPRPLSNGGFNSSRPSCNIKGRDTGSSRPSDSDSSGPSGGELGRGAPGQDGGSRSSTSPSCSVAGGSLFLGSGPRMYVSAAAAGLNNALGDDRQAPWVMSCRHPKVMANWPPQAMANWPPQAMQARQP
ncbi:UNVERIFIED_CONTAM: hypothetical protein FKN15_065141 [Acipenser sinensis]